MKGKITILQEKEESLKKTLETLEKVDEIDVDEAVTTTAPLYRQYVDDDDYYFYVNSQLIFICVPFCFFFVFLKLNNISFIVNTDW